VAPPANKIIINCGIARGSRFTQAMAADPSRQFTIFEKLKDPEETKKNQHGDAGKSNSR
jgi:hypothetical protein